MNATVFMHIELTLTFISCSFHSIMNELDFATMYKGRQDNFRLKPVSNIFTFLVNVSLSLPQYSLPRTMRLIGAVGILHVSRGFLEGVFKEYNILA